MCNGKVPKLFNMLFFFVINSLDFGFLTIFYIMTTCSVQYAFKICTSKGAFTLQSWAPILSHPIFCIICIRYKRILQYFKDTLFSAMLSLIPNRRQ